MIVSRVDTLYKQALQFHFFDQPLSAPWVRLSSDIAASFLPDGDICHIQYRKRLSTNGGTGIKFTMGIFVQNMAPTKRSQNKCKKCGYTWYPRGKSISLKCPACGSSEVKYAGGGLGILALIVVGAVLLGGNKKETNSAGQATPIESAVTSTADIPIAPVEVAGGQHTVSNASNVEPVPLEHPPGKVDTVSERTECALASTGAMQGANCSSPECVSGAIEANK